VSNFTYFSPKGFDIRGRVPFITLVLAVLLFAILLADLPRALLLFATLYALSGPAQALWEAVQSKNSGGGGVPLE
ncbi:MAG: CDP-diacylglycerol--serine O-phosphatidyltransferase, partial [Gammaproteobacteria bacterium]|nr:CDP-diacylglycerol--serine O-phosphatidyltransferase [Gammaproteobacteria bacterium]